jgi:hypothetical protein
LVWIVFQLGVTPFFIQEYILELAIANTFNLISFLFRWLPDSKIWLINRPPNRDQKQQYLFSWLHKNLSVNHIQGFVHCDFLTTKLTFLPVTVLLKESEQFYSWLKPCKVCESA